MATKPTPGGSDGTYGTELNAFLDVSLASDGKVINEALQSASTAPVADAALANKLYVDGHGTVQVVNTQTGAVNTGSTILPGDDTIPQNTEGDEYMTLAITPTSATNKLKIEVVCVFASNTAGRTMDIALFQDSTAGALAAVTTSLFNSNRARAIHFAHFMTTGTTSATTFKVRAGQNSTGTTTFNGSNGARLFGGVMASSITITEIKV